MSASAPTSGPLAMNRLGRRRHEELRPPHRKAHIVPSSRRRARSRPRLEPAEDLLVVRAERGRGGADRSRRLGKARDDVVHRQPAELVVGKVDDHAALARMGVFLELRGGVDGPRRHPRPVEDLHRLGEGALGDEPADDRVDLLAVGGARRRGVEARVVAHVGAADGAEDAHRHRLHGAAHGDPLPVPGPVGIAGRGGAGGVADPGGRLAGRAVDRGVGAEDRDEGLEQREVDHLAAAALPLDLPERHHDSERAVEPRHHVGEGERREGRRLVGKAVLVREARHRLDEGPEPRLSGVGAGLTVAAHADDDELGVAVEQGSRGQAPCAPGRRPGSSRRRPARSARGRAGSRVPDSLRRLSEMLFLLRA